MEKMMKFHNNSDIIDEQNSHDTLIDINVRI